MLNPLHLQEWLASKVDERLIELNVRSLSSTAPYEYLFFHQGIERLNGGRLASKWLNRYRHIEHGGWWCAGVDPLDNWNPMMWGCFKPSQPRKNDDGKLIKYEHPPKQPTRAFLLTVPTHIWRLVSERYNTEITAEDEIRGFWHWVWINNLPIILCEGAKKAGSLLSQGFPAIALPGITGGVRTRDSSGNPVKPYLIPELKHFATLGRLIYICFDQDTKQKTRQAVTREIQKLGSTFNGEGCSCKVIGWNPELGKGVDDLIANHGSEAFQIAYNTAIAFNVWETRLHSQLTYLPSVAVNQRYLSVAIPNGEKLVCLKSPKGTGKTYSLESVVQESIRDGRPVLLLTHRVQLGEELCNRLGIPYVTEIRSSVEGKTLGYGLCVDSLHPSSQANFIATHWDDALVIIDEAEQVLWHLLNASTEVRSHRITILQQLTTLLKNVLSSETGQVILADADLSDLSINFVKEIADKPNLNPWLVVNDWKPSNDMCWDVTVYEDPSPLRWLSELEAGLALGECPLVQVSAQKTKSKWGTQALEERWKRLYPDRKILRIDSESISDPDHPAYGCIGRLNSLLEKYDIVLASPAVETGVSIDIKGHFTSVWGCFQGVQAENAARQATARLREAVPRHLWIASKGIGKIGNGATSYKALMSSQHKLFKINSSLLLDASLADAEANPNPVALWTWAKMAARVNYGMQNYRDAIIEGLKAEGHRIKSADAPFDDDEKRNLKAEITSVRDDLWQAEASAIASEELVTAKEFEELKQKKAKTASERRKERKYSLNQRYGVDITAELVTKDDQKWHPQIRLHYYLTLGREHLNKRDVKVAEARIKEGVGGVWMPDFNRSLLTNQVVALELLGVRTLLDTAREFRGTDADLEKMASVAKQVVYDIRLTLGITIKETDAPIAIAQKFLAKLGLKLTCIKREGTDGKRCRVYKFIPPVDDRERIFSSWLERDGDQFPIAA